MTTTTTTKPVMRKLIIKAMNDIRSLGNEPSFQSVSRHIETSGALRSGDLRENPSSHTEHYAYVWQMTLSFVASQMKTDGELVREHGYPWILTAWGITSIDLVKEIRARKVVETRCGSCFLIHRPEVECW
jgi:hypothetical protein